MMAQRDAAVEVIRTLRKAGWTALLAGGCVRDMLLGRPAKDYDVATNAHPEEVVRLFKRTIKVGAKFGVVVVLTRGVQVEVATFRTEGGYVDGRHPSHVEFADAREDASRRDFTINGMFYDPIERQVIDYVGGRRDLEAKVLRTIGDARTRFDEDYLRMLRALRFSTQLGFEIEPDTWKAVVEFAQQITKISGERIAMELEALLTKPNRGPGAKMLIDSDLASQIFPAVEKGQMLSGTGVLGKLRRNVNFGLALAAFFSGANENTAISACEIIKLSRDHVKHISFLLANRGVLLDGDMPVASLKKLMATPYFRDLFELQRAMQRAGGDQVAGLTNIKRRVRVMAAEEIAPKPLLNGHELIALGAAPGPQVGELAEELYIQQLSGTVKTADQAKRWAQQWLSAHRQ